jgi:hypothetical protein
MSDAPLKFVDMRSVTTRAVLRNDEMIRVLADGLVTELDVTFPVSVIEKLPPALASKTGVAENDAETKAGKSPGTINLEVVGPVELPVAGPARNACAA